MNRRVIPRLALAVVCLAALVACVVNLSFDLDQPGLPLQAGGAGPISQWTLVDLGSNSDVRAHQSDIQSLDLESADVTVTAVNAANNLAQMLSGTVSLRKILDDPSTEVKIGDLQGFRAVKNEHRGISGNPALDAFLLERLHDGGKFYLLVSGTTDARTDLVLDVVLHASMGYDTGLF
jgi:hypothetical protein